MAGLVEANTVDGAKRTGQRVERFRRPRIPRSFDDEDRYRERGALALEALRIERVELFIERPAAEPVDRKAGGEHLRRVEQTVVRVGVVGGPLERDKLLLLGGGELWQGGQLAMAREPGASLRRRSAR